MKICATSRPVQTVVKVLLVAALLCTGCKESRTHVSLRIGANADVGALDSLAARARVDFAVDERVSDVYLADLGGVDLAVDPWTVGLDVPWDSNFSQADFYAYGPVYIAVHGLKSGRIVASAVLSADVEGTELVDVTLALLDPACDEDGDGFKDCARPACCQAGGAPAFADCDDTDARAHPFANSAACRACEATCGGGGPEMDAVEVVPDVVETEPDASDAVVGDIEVVDVPAEADVSDAYVPDGCTPDCVGKECGDDGCGGSCGGCTNGRTCDVGQCVCAGSTDDDCNDVDDDCDGQTDEGYGSPATACGVGACEATGSRTCVAGAETDSCTPGLPAANDATCNAVDDDCDGSTDEDYLGVTTTCGKGACAATGKMSCVGGSEINSCVAGTAGVETATCDGVDNDCDGQTDEGYLADTTCGVGYCRTYNTPSSCTAGVVTPCMSGAKLSTTDATCDGVDDNCNGTNDENAVCDDGNKCNGISECVSGSCQQTMAPVTCATPDACHTIGTCNPGTGLCSEPVGNEGAFCADDGNACNGVSTCVSGTCTQTTAPVTCTAQDECHVVGTCNTATGVCSNPVGNEGAFCADDGNPCNGVSTCVSGTCTQTTAPLTCEEGYYCAANGQCEPEVGCTTDESCPSQQICDLATSECRFAKVWEWWAPTFFQDTDGDHAGHDVFTAIDFDSDAVILNNGSNKDDPNKPAVVYVSFVRTMTHSYIGYYLYHPWRYSHSGSLGTQYENSMKGLLLVVESDGSMYGKIALMVTVTEDSFFEYVPTASDLSGEAMIDGNIRFDVSDHHPIAYIHFGDHAVFGDAYMWNNVSNWETSGFPGGDGIVYRWGNVAEIPSSDNDPDVKYELRYLKDELWPLRFQTKGGQQPFDEFGHWTSVDYNARSLAPWRFNDVNYAARPHGEILFNPADFVKNLFDSGWDTFSHEYSYNPYAVSVSIDFLEVLAYESDPLGGFADPYVSLSMWEGSGREYKALDIYYGLQNNWYGVDVDPNLYPLDMHETLGRYFFYGIRYPGRHLFSIAVRDDDGGWTAADWLMEPSESHAYTLVGEHLLDWTKARADVTVCVEGDCECLPCLGRECGSDGCGGNCGTCDSGEICVAGQCCLCAEGPCCDGCDYRLASYKCAEGLTTEYTCTDGTGCGADVYIRHQDQYCSGTSALCEGALQWDEAVVYDDCTAAETCAVEDGTCNVNAACSAICVLTGTPGSVVNCPLSLARGDETYLPAVQLQLTLDFDEAIASVSSLSVCGPFDPPFDTIPCAVGGNECDGFGDPTSSCNPDTLFCFRCQEFAPDDTNAALATGHTIATCAQPPADCAANAFDMVFWGTEHLPITSAWLSGDTLTGDAEFVTVRFTLNADPGAGAAVTVSPVGFVAVDELATSLPVSVVSRPGLAPERLIVTRTNP